MQVCLTSRGYKGSHGFRLISTVLLSLSLSKLNRGWCRMCWQRRRLVVLWALVQVRALQLVGFPNCWVLVCAVHTVTVNLEDQLWAQHWVPFSCEVSLSYFLGSNNTGKLWVDAVQFKYKGGFQAAVISCLSNWSRKIKHEQTYYSRCWGKAQQQVFILTTTFK